MRCLDCLLKLLTEKISRIESSVRTSDRWFSPCFLSFDPIRRIIENPSINIIDFRSINWVSSYLFIFVFSIATRRNDKGRMRFYSLIWIWIFIEGIWGEQCSNYETGIHRTGQWYIYIQTVRTIESCCSMCNAETTRCQSWLFVQTNSGSLTSGCYLYERISPINVTSNCGQSCTSGIKSSSMSFTGRCVYPGGNFELAVDRPGSTYINLKNISNYQICCGLCQLEGDRCRSWTFTRTGAIGKQSGCALKNSVASISSTPCVPCTSGIK